MREKAKKYFKQMVFWAGVLLFVIGSRCIPALAEGADREASLVYEADNYCVTFSVNDSWQNGKKAFVYIENKGTSTIHNWSLTFKMQGGIAEIWDAKVCARVGDFYVIKNTGYNQDILPGDTVSFGLILEEIEQFSLPQSFLIPMRTAEVDSSAYMVEVIENFDWSEGYSGSIMITNQSNREIGDWELEIAFGTEITSIWNGSIISQKDDTYKIENSSYHQNIQPGESISIGFLGKKLSDTITVTEYRLTEVTTAEAVDNIVNKEVFEEIIPITENYFISPLYTIDENIAAYLVQYYDEAGKGCSYIVVNNEVNSEERYYIEFGYGDAPVITGLRTAYLEDIKDDAYQVLYLGGYDYYIKNASGIYGIKDGELCKLKEEDLQCVSDVMTGTQYYTEGETLTYGDILAKEIGYSSCEKNIDNRSSEMYITMADTREAYRQVMSIRDGINYSENEMRIRNHCAPTAATNMLLYLSQKYPQIGVINEGNNKNFAEAFVLLYEEMKTNVESTGTLIKNTVTGYEKVIARLGHDGVRAKHYSSVSWDKATECLENGAVHLALIGSQIYKDHAVLGVGHISFSHSTGWVSKYFQIIDGWERGYRYVNYSLGISYISLVELNFGPTGAPYPTPIPPANY